MFSDPKKVLDQFNIDTGMTVADFGSGSGHYSLLLSEKVGMTGKVFAFDIQKDLLARLKKQAEENKIENIQYSWADLDEPNSTSLKDSSVDRIVIANLLFQTEDKKAVIREAKRVLKDNGQVLVVDWSESFSGLGPKEADVLKSEIAERIFTEEGFNITKGVDAGEHHYGFICKKT
jgi:ubiquinone/menaquinone biosynthesis C-methylase UbiE